MNYKLITWYTGIDTLSVTVDEIQTEASNDKVLEKILKYLRDDKWPDHITDKIMRPYCSKLNELMIVEGVLIWGLSQIKVLKISFLVEWT